MEGIFCLRDRDEFVDVLERQLVLPLNVVGIKFELKYEFDNFLLV